LLTLFYSKAFPEAFPTLVFILTSSSHTVHQLPRFTMAQKPLSAANGEQSQKTTVLVVGAGPVGIFLTLLLARANIPVTLIEARDVLDKDHKAVAQSPVVFPILKHAGILEDVQAAAGELRSTSSSFRRTTDKEIVAEVPKVAGRPGPLILSQGTFSHLLMDHVKKYESAKVLMGHSLQEVDTSSPDTVTATIKTTDGSLKTISAAYLIGADGGRSRVRNLTGIQFEGITLPHQLIATDVFYPFDTHGFSRGANFMADPEHYGLIAPINSDGLWRVSFSVPNNMKQEEIEAVVPEKFEAMFPGPRPLNYKLDRVAPYKAQQLCAKTFRAGRVLLIGDAAHCTFLPVTLSQSLKPSHGSNYQGKR